MKNYRQPEFINSEQEIIIRNAYRQAQEVLKDQDIKINRKNFPEYDVAMMQDDLGYVEEKEGQFSHGKTEEEKKTNKLSLVLEALFFEQAEMSEWLGSNVETIKSSRFDDIKNGVDMIAEFLIDEDEQKSNTVRNVSGHMGLAFDVTFANKIKEKLERVKSEIDHNNLAEVRYFHSDHFVGKLVDIPRIVAAIDGRTVNELAELWLGEDKKDKNKLAFHPVQMQILEGAIIQLRTFKQYAEKTKHENVIAKLDWALRTMEKIYQERKKILESAKKGEDYSFRDNAFTALKGNLGQIFGMEV